MADLEGKQRFHPRNHFPIEPVHPVTTNITLGRVLPMNTGHVVTHFAEIVMHTVKQENSYEE